jgi:hypothetical protein
VVSVAAKARAHPVNGSRDGIARKSRPSFYRHRNRGIDECRACPCRQNRVIHGNPEQAGVPSSTYESPHHCNDFDKRHRMNPARLHDAVQLCAVPVRRLALAMCAAVILCGVGRASYAAPANDDTAQPSPPPVMEQRFEAPIGHRQPTVQDVPAGVLRDEGAATPNQLDFDKKLDICRGC